MMEMRTGERHGESSTDGIFEGMKKTNILALVEG